MSGRYRRLVIPSADEAAEGMTAHPEAVPTRPARAHERVAEAIAVHAARLERIRAGA